MFKFFRSAKIGIKNLLTWFPIIWQDRQWDHTYLLAMIRRKLGLMEEFFRTSAHYVNCEMDADKMRECCLLLDRLLDDVYHDEIFAYHYAKWGEPEFNFESSDKEGLSKLVINYQNVKNEDDEKQEREEFRKLIDAEQKAYKQDLEQLFAILRDNVERWWD